MYNVEYQFQTSHTHKNCKKFDKPVQINDVNQVIHVFMCSMPFKLNDPSKKFLMFIMFALMYIIVSIS